MATFPLSLSNVYRSAPNFLLSISLNHPAKRHILLRIRRTLSRLGELLVSGRSHVPPQLDEDGLHGVLALPLCEAR